ncbi:MAG: LacI family DNA-binding transcriptional regulator [Lachnospiraceae bacterium]|nr:LacI family DNA-binding transcriptional regulator [Lachnospiraceae bacterium]
MRTRKVKKVNDISATIKDIAIKCNVSEGTVDRALNDRPGIKKETKEKILQVAKELGYRPNHLASCLAKGSSKTIGVVCTGLGNPFFSSFVEAIERMAYENGYYLNLILTHGSREKEMEGINYLVSRQVEGLIIIPLGFGAEYEQELLQFHIPIVTVYNRISDKFTHVDVDGRLIMKNAVQRMVEKGYRRIAYLDLGYGTPCDLKNNRYSLNQRRLGYIDGIENGGLGIPVIMTNYEWEPIEEFLTGGDGKPAILCPFDAVAIHVLDIMRQHNILVPEQVGIMGFDNISILDSISPRICSVDCEIKGLGQKAFQALLQIINGDTVVRDYVTNYTFVEGESL